MDKPKHWIKNVIK